MKTKSLIIAGLLLGVIVLAGPQTAMAANNYTPACTQIQNIATISYQVGGVQQSNIQSNSGTPTTFYIGVKVDVLVTRTDLAAVSVYPGSLATALTFAVTNNGNATQKYALTAIAEPTGTANPFGAGTDSYDGTNVKTNGTVGLTSSIASLAPDASQAVTIVVDTPLSQVNNELAVWGLKAQSQWVGTTTDINTKNSTATGNTIGGAVCTAAGPATATIDVVAADVATLDDAANDGAHSERDAYLVSAANLTVTKSSTVYWDPVNLTINPKAIPGAVITYTVTIANAASVANATNVSLVDDLNSEITANHLTFGNGMTGAPNTSFNDGSGVGKNDCTGSGAGYGIVVGGVCKSNVYAGLDGASWNDAADPGAGGTANKVVASGLTVNAGSSVVIKYQATIK